MSIEVPEAIGFHRNPSIISFLPRVSLHISISRCDVPRESAHVEVESVWICLSQIEVFLQVKWRFFWRSLTPIILTPFNYLDWTADMQIILHNKGLYKVTMGREVEPQQPFEKSKYLNKLDEAFGFMCIHISTELLFHLDGLRTPKEVWGKLKSLFGKKDE